MKKAKPILPLLLLLLSGTLGCAATTIGKPVVWPDPPEKARIRFVTAFRTGDDLDTSGWAHFRRSLRRTFSKELQGDVEALGRHPSNRWHLRAQRRD